MQLASTCCHEIRPIQSERHILGKEIWATICTCYVQNQHGWYKRLESNSSAIRWKPLVTSLVVRGHFVSDGCHPWVTIPLASSQWSMATWRGPVWSYHQMSPIGCLPPGVQSCQCQQKFTYKMHLYTLEVCLQLSLIHFLHVCCCS